MQHTHHPSLFPKGWVAPKCPLTECLQRRPFRRRGASVLSAETGMTGFIRAVLAGASLSAMAACADLNGTPDGGMVLLGAAFQSVPAGFSANSTSFDPSGDLGDAFMPRDMAPGTGFHGGPGGGGGKPGPGGPAGHGQRGHGFGEGGLRALLMGGGLGPDFTGLIGFGRGKGRGPFGVFRLPDSCTFSETTGRVTCPETEKHGLTVNTSFAFRDAAGAAQPTFDTATTNSVNVATTVTGTKRRRDGQVTTNVAHASDRTIVGIAPGSDRRTVSGVASAREETEGTRDGITFTALREAADTTDNVVIPIVEGRPTIPSAGTVIRRMKVTITKEGEEPTTRLRREKVTFDGTNVVKIEITQDDVTKHCTLTLPGKTLVCE